MIWAEIVKGERCDMGGDCLRCDMGGDCVRCEV